MQVTKRETLDKFNCDAFERECAAAEPCAIKMVNVHLVTVDQVQPRADLYPELERGNILFFDHTPFPLSDGHREILRSTGLASGSHHKNIAYRPAADKVTGFDPAAVRDREALRVAMRGYSQLALQFLRTLLPRCLDNCRVDSSSGHKRKKAVSCLRKNGTICCTWMHFPPGRLGGI